jgi:MFS superfamily sulfate permease-like transporter
LGIAADATPEAGLITATWAVLAAGLFGGSHHNIVGPTGDFSDECAIIKKMNQNRYLFVQVL